MLVQAVINSISAALAISDKEGLFDIFMVFFILFSLTVK